MIDCGDVENILEELAQEPAVHWRVVGEEFEKSENGIRNEIFKLQTQK